MDPRQRPPVEILYVINSIRLKETFCLCAFSVCLCLCVCRMKREGSTIRVIPMGVRGVPHPHLVGKWLLKLPCLQCPHEGDVIEAVPLQLLPSGLLLAHTCTWLHHGSPLQQRQHTHTSTHRRKKHHHKPRLKSCCSVIEGLHWLQYYTT